MWVSLGRARARTKNYTTSVFDSPGGKADGCPDDLPLHDVKDFRRCGLNRGRERNTSSNGLSAFVMIASLPSFRKWWSQTGSNRRPPACKAGALPTELWPRSRDPEGANLRGGKAVASKVVGLGRFELPTSRLSSARSNQLSYKPQSLESS